MRRKCSKCKKVKECRFNHRCKDKIQCLCLDCAKKISANWYVENRERKLEYMYNYYRGIKLNQRTKKWTV